MSRLQYYVTQEKGTERPFTGDFIDEHEPGVFSCVVCKQHLFSTTTKFDSGSGWPSFYDVINSDKVRLIEDQSLGINY